jgi:hypothetical protein
VHTYVSEAPYLFGNLLGTGGLRFVAKGGPLFFCLRTEPNPPISRTAGGAKPLSLYVSPGCAIKKSIERHQPATFSRVLFISPTNVPQPHRSQQPDTSGNNRSHEGVNRLF